MNLPVILNKIKPSLKESSIQAYVRNIEKLSERVNGKREFDNLEWLNDKEKVLNKINEMGDNTKRNYLNSVIVFFQNNKDYEDNETWKEYSKLRDDINAKFKKSKSENKKTDKQNKNWLTKEEYQNIVKQYQEYLTKHKVLQSKPDKLNKDELNKLMEYVLIKFYQEIPSRNDFHSLKIVNKKEYNDLPKDTNQNYLVMERNNIHVIINDWKTKKNEKDTRTITLSPELQKLVRAYRRKAPNREYMFVSNKEQPLTRNGLTKLLIKMFKVFYPDKNISSSMLRHIYLSHKYSDTMKEMKEDQNNLGHSGETQKEYIKT